MVMYIVTSMYVIMVKLQLPTRTLFLLIPTSKQVVAAYIDGLAI
jgi:hypothetical protein